MPAIELSHLEAVAIADMLDDYSRLTHDGRKRSDALQAHDILRDRITESYASPNKTAWAGFAVRAAMCDMGKPFEPGHHGRQITKNMVS